MGPASDGDAADADGDGTGGAGGQCGVCSGAEGSDGDAEGSDGESSGDGGEDGRQPPGLLGAAPRPAAATRRPSRIPRHRAASCSRR